MGALCLELHQRGETLGVGALENFVRLHVELLEFVDGQVNASAQRVFANVTDDVGELKGLTQLVRVLCGLCLGLTKDTCRYLADNAGHQVAVTLQAHKVQVAGLFQIHLAAFDDGLQVALLDAKRGGMRHQRLHHRVARLTGKGFGHLAVPPGQLGLGNARIHHVIHHIVDLAAEGIKRGDGGPAVGWQEEKGVVKAAARGGGLVLYVLRGGHSV